MAIPTNKGKRTGKGLKAERGGTGKAPEKGLNAEREGRSQPSERGLKRERGLFNKELRKIMYGYGDDANPMPETVLLVDDIVVDYVTDTMHTAQDLASARGSKLTTEDILFVIRKDWEKLNRAKELLSSEEEQKRFRKLFPTDEQNLFGNDA